VAPPPSSMEVWGRRRTGTVTARRRAAVAIRCSFVGESGGGRGRGPSGGALPDAAAATGFHTERGQ
jgi:hypothetical protein